MKRTGLSPQRMMSPCVLLTTMFTLPLAVGWAETAEREVQIVCAGKEFRLPVYSTSRKVIFTPNPEGPKRVLLERTMVMDPRFEWTRDKMLVLKEVTHSDQGLYAVKMFSGFTDEAVRLVVSECTKSYHRHYGENFELNIPENGSLLEFSPWGAPTEAMPIVLWNQTDPETSDAGRGRLLRGGKNWVAERVTQVDQGNYTVRDKQGKALSLSTLTVRGHFFNVTRFTKESLNLPLFLPVPHTHLIYTPARYRNESSLDPFDPKPPRGSVQLIREGQITNHDLHYRGLISLGRRGTVNEVVIASLTSRHGGVYEIRDQDGNLVSSTFLQVIEKGGGWRAFLKSITVSCGLFLSLAGVILFLKRYPFCSKSQFFALFRTNRTPTANPPRDNIQSYTPVMVGTPRAENRGINRLAAVSSPNHNSTTMQHTPDGEEERISFSLPGASDCLHSSEVCVQFQIKKDVDKDKSSKSWESFFTLPLDTDTSESCVYTSDKLNFL